MKKQIRTNTNKFGLTRKTMCCDIRVGVLDKNQSLSRKTSAADVWSFAPTVSVIISLSVRDLRLRLSFSEEIFHPVLRQHSRHQGGKHPHRTINRRRTECNVSLLGHCCGEKEEDKFRHRPWLKNTINGLLINIFNSADGMMPQGNVFSDKADRLTIVFLKRDSA